jgi:hypothetical protein
MGTKQALRVQKKALEVGFSSSLLHDIKLYCRGQVNCGGFNALLIRIEFSFTQEDAQVVVGSLSALEELEQLQKSFYAPFCIRCKDYYPDTRGFGRVCVRNNASWAVCTPLFVYLF